MHAPPRPPVTRRGDDVDEIHGVSVSDPYRWLEDPDAPETRAWVKAQQAVTDAWLAEIPARDRIAARLREVFDFERFGAPFRRGEQIFWLHNTGLQPHSVLFRKRDPQAEPEVVLDPNTLSDDGTVGLSSLAISRDGRWLAYGVSDGGSDWSTLRIRDLETGEELPDLVQWVKFCAPTFLPDGSALLYSRFPASGDGPKGTHTAANKDHQLWLHRLGTDQADDVMLFARPDHPDWVMSAEVHSDANLVTIHVSAAAGDDNALWMADITGSEVGPVRPLVPRFDAVHWPVTVVGRELVLQTDWEAPRHRLVAVDLDRPEREHWRELVPEGEDALVEASRTGDRVFLRTLHHAHTRVATFRIAEAGGRVALQPAGDVALPGVGTAAGFHGRPEHRDTYFVFSSFVQPSTVYRFDLDTDTVSVHFAPEVPFDVDDLHVEQIFVDSPDGTAVPAFVCWKGELVRDGSRPCLLYGYGGFAQSLVPQFRTSLVPWLELGGLYVSANLRGGGEYGRAWHQAGKRGDKQRVFDDFLAVAEHLVAQRITSPRKLAVHGHSNGGLLVGAVLVQRPELFGAAIPAVGVLDMLRYHTWTIGHAWADEYGTADDPEAFGVLLEYSPLHNVRERAYPATLVVTADHDDRVVPAHSFKFGAALQHAQQGDAPVLLRIEERAGHGASKPLSKIIDEDADIFAFLVRALDVTP
ncbi:MAG: prolyl oligopeptidase family serine peptidase [Myxococcota bacterium]